MRRYLLAFLLCLFAFEADGQGEWMELQVSASESTLGEWYGNDSDGIACNMLNSVQSYGQLPATVFYSLPYLPQTDSVRVVAVTTYQQAGVELQAFTSKQASIQNMWVLRAASGNPEANDIPSEIPDSDWYGTRYYAFGTQPHIVARFVGMTRPMMSSVRKLNGSLLGGVDCLSVYVDTTARHPRKLSVLERGENAAPNIRRWVNVLGESVGALEHASDGVYFSDGERALRIDGVTYYGR